MFELFFVYANFAVAMAFGITLAFVLETKWYTYVIQAKKAKIHAFQQQHVTQVMGLSFWSHSFYDIE